MSADSDTDYGNTDLNTDGGSVDDTDEMNEDINDHNETTLPPTTLRSGGFSFATTHRNPSQVITESTIPLRHLAREGVIDLGDTLVMELFEESEILELKELIPEVQKPDEHFARSLGRFWGAKSNTFREILETVPYREENVTYQREIHADAEWVNQVFMHMQVPD